MKAAVIEQQGGVENIVYRDWDDPEPAAGEVRVRVAACGLNHLDIFVRRGMPDDADRLHAIVIHSGPMKPEDAYVAVKHRKRWFWIDYADPDAKQEFLSLVIMTTLANAQDHATGPILTIPTSG